jgi:hypothetical protein
MKTVLLKLDKDTAARLSVFCKRAIIERVKPFAGDETEANKMLKALDNLRDALEEQGFSPR